MVYHVNQERFFVRDVGACPVLDGALNSFSRRWSKDVVARITIAIHVLVTLGIKIANIVTENTLVSQGYVSKVGYTVGSIPQIIRRVAAARHNDDEGICLRDYLFRREVSGINGFFQSRDGEIFRAKCITLFTGFHGAGPTEIKLMAVESGGISGDAA